VIDYQQFTVDLIKATKLALAEIASQRPGETVSVFGYETDDDVVVLTPVANTTEEHERMVERGIYSEEGQVDSLMIQEWPLYGVGRNHFDQLSETVNQYVHEPLKARGSESFAERKLNLLRAFGRALQKAASAPGGPFLAIFNPDPGLESLALYYCIARLINPPGSLLDLYKQNVDETLQANGTTLEKALRELKTKGMLIQAL
jgi:hypothetical protein